MIPSSSGDAASSQGLLDVLIRAGLLAIMLLFCFRIFSPFLDLLLWSVILAITLYPLHSRLKRRLGLRDGYTAALIVLVALAVVMLPVYLLGSSLVDSVEGGMAMVRNGRAQLPPPPENLAGWPLVGPWLSGVWQQAVENLPELVQKYLPQIRNMSLSALGKLAGVGMGLMIFIVALIIAGIFVAYGVRGHRSAVQIVSRICGPSRGPQITELCTATVRAVAVGVVGIAFIQMLLVGIGFVVKGIPGSGLLALAVLLLGIMQLPATLITLPVIIFVFATEGASTASVVFALYVFVAGLVDNVLKPLLLGRGVNVPMPVVLIGALGGMVTNGVIGLFIGPVILAVAYQLFWQWVGDPQARHIPEAR
jgi:predicted PurR-regulated permease PerM